MKNLTCLCAILLCTSFITFTGCSSDDDDDTDAKNKEYAAKISKTYSNSDLSITLNGAALADQSIAFKTNDLKTGEVTLYNLIPGEPEIVVGDLAMGVLTTYSTSGNSTYSLNGSTGNGNRDISVSGTVGDALSLTVTFKVTSNIVKTWKPAEVPFTFVITPASAEKTINMHGLFGQEEIPLAALPPVIEQLGNSVFTYLVNFSLQMKDNGNLIANWAPVMLPFEAGSSEEGLVRYNVVDGQVFVKLAFTFAISEMMGDLAPLFSEALPLNFAFDSNGGMKAYVTKEMMAPYIDAIIPMLQGLMGGIEIPEAIGGDLGLTASALVAFLGEVSTAIKESSQFDIVVYLVPA